MIIKSVLETLHEIQHKIHQTVLQARQLQYEQQFTVLEVAMGWQ